MNLIVLTKHQIERNYSRERSSLLDGSGGGLLGSGLAGSLLGSGLAGSLLGNLLGGSLLGGAFGGGSFACSDFIGYKKKVRQLIHKANQIAALYPAIMSIASHCSHMTLWHLISWYLVAIGSGVRVGDRVGAGGC